jgi:hypothetical protein
MKHSVEINSEHLLHQYITMLGRFHIARRSSERVTSDANKKQELVP